uniref:Uncharacterized protein n=1 Tax=Panagrolaimus sp. ES5 TaxID=591445 RepID=A0AC34G7X8_9BILA
MGILESMKNAFKLAEQEERERQGERDTDDAIPVNVSENVGGYGEENQSSSNSLKIITTKNPLEEATTTSTNLVTKNNGYVDGIDESLKSNLQTSEIETEKITNLLKNIYDNIKTGSETNSDATISVNQKTSTEISVKNLYKSSTITAKNSASDKNYSDLLKMKNIIFIESPEDEQKCIGDPGEPGTNKFQIMKKMKRAQFLGNDGYDGIDGLPGLDGLTGIDGEKVTYGDICNC